MFSQTLAYVNSKNEKDKETDEDAKKKGVSMERSKAVTKKKFRRPIITKSKYNNNNKHYLLVFSIKVQLNSINKR